MIQYVTGSLFTSPAQTLVNTVNTEGVMGKGIALTFKRLFPDMFDDYKRACQARSLKIGTLHVFRAHPKLIVNFPTKTTWRRPSKPEYIRAGLETFVANYHAIGIRSAAFPPLGCGNGELSFEHDVQPIMTEYLDKLPIPVFVYPPLTGDSQSQPEHRQIKEMRQWIQREEAVTPFEALWGDLEELIQARREFSTLSGVPFTARILDAGTEDERVTVFSDAQIYDFDKERVAELWAELRQHLVLTDRSFSGRAKESSFLFAILAALPYVEPIRIGETYYNFLNAPSSGVRLHPPSLPSQPQQRALALA